MTQQNKLARSVRKVFLHNGSSLRGIHTEEPTPNNNDIKHDDALRNYIQDINKYFSTLSILTLSIMALNPECFYDEFYLCLRLSVLSVSSNKSFMLSVIMQNVIMLSVVVLNVLAQTEEDFRNIFVSNS
jgi:hypothetical protein